MQHDVTLTNNGGTQIFETKTRIKISPGEVANFQVNGDKYNQALANNIQQLNIMLGYEAINYNSIEIEQGGDAGLVVINAAYENKILTYTGGTIDCGGVFGVTPAFGLTRVFNENDVIDIRLPLYSNFEENPFSQIFVLISPHQTISTAIDYQNQSSGAYLSDFTAAGANSGLAFVEAMEGLSSNTLLEITATPRLMGTLTRAGNNLTCDVKNFLTNEITTAISTLPGVTLYLHVVAILDADALVNLDPGQISLTLSKPAILG